jgi:hypothetical protein
MLLSTFLTSLLGIDWVRECISISLLLLGCRLLIILSVDSE